MADKRENFKNLTTDADRISLGDMLNDKNQKLQKFQTQEQTILRRGKDKAGELPALQRQVTILSNEVAILDSTIKIYDATYGSSWHTDTAEEIRAQWTTLNQKFKSDKMRKLLAYLWSQLQQETDHKHGKGN